MPAAQTRSDIRTYKGVGVSPGIAIGRAVIVEKRVASVYRVPIRDEEVAAEVTRFLESLEKTRDELLELKAKVSRSMGDEYAQIFEAHAMIVGDASFADKVAQKIENEQVNAEWALAEVQEELQARFASFDDDYLRERVADVKDVAERVLVNLQGVAHHDLSEIAHDVIIIADDLTPSDTIHFNRRPIVGFATEVGGRTSHTSIIAKSLFMPAVIGVPRLTKIVDNDELVIVDGYEGTILINPTQAMIAEYRSRVSRHEEAEQKLLTNRELAAMTKDNHRVSLQANIELIEEVGDAVKFGAEGIGLYRSEFLYISTSPDLPTEEEHFNIYRKLAEGTAPNWCVIRTFDLGGKKLAREVMGSKEDNPVLGLRALRLCMQHRDMFKTQLRALLRASAFGKIKIMFPLVSGVQELRQVKTLVREIRLELDAEGIPYNRELQIGIMIEVPSAAVIADLLATEADFFAIGTNDLIQYSLAIDRGNENVSYLYEPLHPALLRLIKGVIDAGKRAGIPVSMCGEMASDPIYAIVLLGLGLEIFSMNPSSIPVLKNVVRSVRYKDCKRIAESALQKKTAQEIEEYIIESVAMRFPEGLASKSL
ncbi:MAG: phosphoenolpyruvate--protein phosphotransferase [Acidobacteria bacterium]|nr:phosphoenolpyruvate--protein phosphotransferase [Acidobacteriota bacterium]MBV9474598.1 phosphoenolpyruvate--protein phosphotransferase [Acidobacteriota bacterium]